MAKSAQMNQPHFQQITLEQAQGKVFDRLLISKDDEQILILFRDQTFAVLNVEHWGEESGDISESEPISIKSIIERYRENDLIELGLVTKEEIERREAERQREWSETCRARDIATLRRLQSLYPDVR